MNRILVASLALIGLIAVGTRAFAQVADGQGTDRIRATGHNFTDFGWSGNEICRPCHTPHNAMTAAVAGTDRLWSHKLTDATYKIGETTVGGVTSDVTMSAATGLDKVSRLCMSCHDGTVALDAFGGTVLQTGTQNMTKAGPLLGTDLTNDHPVGTNAIYDPLNSRSGVRSLKPFTDGASGVSGKVYVMDVVNNVPTSATLSLRPMTGLNWTTNTNTTPGQTTVKITHTNANGFVVGCTTCHTPHGKGFTKLLNASNNSSNVCLSCHYK